MFHVKQLWLVLLVGAAHAAEPPPAITATAAMVPTATQALAPTAMTLQMQGMSIVNLGWQGNGIGNIYIGAENENFQAVADSFNQANLKAQDWANKEQPLQSIDLSEPKVHFITVKGDDPERMRATLSSLPFVTKVTLSTDAPVASADEIPTEEDRNPTFSLTCPWETCRKINIIQ